MSLSILQIVSQKVTTSFEQFLETCYMKRALKVAVIQLRAIEEKTVQDDFFDKRSLKDLQAMFANLKVYQSPEYAGRFLMWVSNSDFELSDVDSEVENVLYEIYLSQLEKQFLSYKSDYRSVLSESLLALRALLNEKNITSDKKNRFILGATAEIYNYQNHLNSYEHVLENDINYFPHLKTVYECNSIHHKIYQGFRTLEKSIELFEDIFEEFYEEREAELIRKFS